VLRTLKRTQTNQYTRRNAHLYFTMHSIDFLPRPKTPKCIGSVTFHTIGGMIRFPPCALVLGVAEETYLLCLTLLSYHASLSSHYQGLAHPPATSTHSAKQDPCFPSTSTISVSHLQRHPTPFSFTVSHVAQYSSSSIRFFSSNVVISRKGVRFI
jgi:hypothetical protein